jgi:hypothetical protein
MIFESGRKGENGSSKSAVQGSAVAICWSSKLWYLVLNSWREECTMNSNERSKDVLETGRKSRVTGDKLKD